MRGGTLGCHIVVGDKNPSVSEARDPGGIIPLRWATSFRNPRAALSRYTRAASSESAAHGGKGFNLLDYLPLSALKSSSA
jgi:hypothetical protein